jgi:hypothetical protein
MASASRTKRTFIFIFKAMSSFIGDPRPWGPFARLSDVSALTLKLIGRLSVGGAQTLKPFHP